MIDCCQIEVSAIRKAFDESINILLRHEYMKGAWKKHMRLGIKFINSTMKSVQTYATIRNYLNPKI
jgi:hypothetical protein